MSDAFKFARAHPVRVLALVLGTLVLAGGDLVELLPAFAPALDNPYFRVFHDSHDVLALLLLVYGAYSWAPAIGMAALVLFVAVHVPYVALTYRDNVPEMFRLGVTIVAAYIAIRLIAQLRHLYSNQEDIARTLQEALLVVPESIDGADFAHFYHSAAHGTMVGGDFYDVFELEHRRIAVMIGDISGKGLESAALTSRVKMTMRAYAEAGDLPEQVIAKTNEIVKKTFPHGMFVTTFFGVLDTESGVLDYCSAGHPRALLKREGGDAVFLPSASPLIGAFSEFSYLGDHKTLRPGDILLLYTDGVTEARHDRDFFGDDRLRELFSELGEQVTVDRVPEAIFEEVVAYAKGNLVDDVAIVALSLRH